MSSDVAEARGTGAHPTEPMPPHRPSYIRVVMGKLQAPGGSQAEDGAALVEQCLGSIHDASRFPPRLFILFVTPAFQPYHTFVAAVRNKLAELGHANVPFIGSSVAAFLFDEGACKEGALLVCWASRFVHAKTAVSHSAQKDPEGAIPQVLKELGITNEHDVNPRGNRFLLTFLPGFGEGGDLAAYKAHEILQALVRRTYARLPMFGGVSSAGLEAGPGFQIMGDAVYTGAAVVALVTCDIAYGVALSHGLTDTGKVLRVKHVADDGRTITDFWEGPPEEVMSGLDAEGVEPLLFRLESPHGEPVIAVPFLKGEAIHLVRAVPERSVIHVLTAKPDRLNDAVGESVTWAMGRVRMLPSRVAGFLGISCTAWYRERERIGLDVEASLRKARERFQGAEFATCYMDGEVGLDERGRSVLGNWSVSVALFVDDVPARSELSLMVDAMAKHGPAIGAAATVDDAARAVLDCVGAVGYPGGMLSLVLKDGEREWIVARKAMGGLWEKKVLPLTQRILLGPDVLAVVAREKKAEYVKDSTEDKSSDQSAIHAGQIISQYIIPLPNERGTTIAILQVDLGDMREVQKLPEEQRLVLDAIGRSAASAITRAMRAEELELSWKLDEILAECLAKDTVEEAAASFVKKAAEAVGTTAHVRLRVQDTTTFRLVGGVGPYFEVAWRERRDIDVGDHSPSGEALRSRKSLFCNDAANDPTSKGFRQRFKGTSLPLWEAHEKIAAYANLPIAQRPGEDPLGVLCFMSETPWFFTEWRLRSLEDIGRRLFVLLTHVRSRRTERESAAKLDFLRHMTPKLDEKLDLHSALRKQMDQARRIAQADVVSCFLWDRNLKCFILRAQCNWANPQWEDAARYSSGEGMTGKLALRAHPCYIDDRAAFRETTGQETGQGGKYTSEMLGAPVPSGYTYEVIALPLNFRGDSLGIVTMYRRRQSPIGDTPSGFATCQGSP